MVLSMVSIITLNIVIDDLLLMANMPIETTPKFSLNDIALTLKSVVECLEVLKNLRSL